MDQKIIVNAIGESCPIPVVKATRALREMTQPGTLEVLVSSENAVENLKHMAEGHKLAAKVEHREDGAYAVRIAVTAPIGDAPIEDQPLCCTSGNGNGLVVAVGDDCMGGGEAELGRLLMKSFLFAVGQLPVLPKAILFYNAGAKLTVEGSEVLEDLRNLADQGVDILTCGTCLNFYHLTEKLAVGSVTNMYTIVETLAGAEKVIRP